MHRARTNTGHQMDTDRLPQRYCFSLSNLRKTGKEFDQRESWTTRTRQAKRVPSRPTGWCSKPGKIRWQAETLKPGMRRLVEQLPPIAGKPGRGLEARADPPGRGAAGHGVEAQPRHPDRRRQGRTTSLRAGDTTARERSRTQNREREVRFDERGWTRRPSGAPATRRGVHSEELPAHPSTGDGTTHGIRARQQDVLLEPHVDTLTGPNGDLRKPVEAALQILHPDVSDIWSAPDRNVPKSQLCEAETGQAARCRSAVPIRVQMATVGGLEPGHGGRRGSLRADARPRPRSVLRRPPTVPIGRCVACRSTGRTSSSAFSLARTSGGCGRLGPLAGARGRGTREGVTLQEANVTAAWRFGERDAPRAPLPFGASMRRGIRHQAGAALGWPLGRRFLVRADARSSGLRVGIGAGIGFCTEPRRCPARCRFH